MWEVICITAICLAAHVPGTGSLAMKGVTVPKQLILGQSATLECKFDLEGSKLYSLKWYKNGEEFYRFMPSMENQFEVFRVSGVNIDLASSTSNSVRLSPITFETEGIYRCEVSNEFPVFDTVSKAEILKVVAIPSGPYISPAPVSISPGDQVDLNCSVTGSLPRPTVVWYINKTPVPASTLNMSRSSQSPMSILHFSTHLDGRVDTYSNIRFRVRERNFQDGRVLVKCSAILGDFFMKSDEIVLTDKRTNIRVVEVKSDSEESGKILGLFDDDSYREEEIFSTRTNSSFNTTHENLFIFSLFLTLTSKLWQFGET